MEASRLPFFGEANLSRRVWRKSCAWNPHVRRFQRSTPLNQPCEPLDRKRGQTDKTWRATSFGVWRRLNRLRSAKCCCATQQTATESLLQNVAGMGGIRKSLKAKTTSVTLFEIWLMLETTRWSGKIVGRVRVNTHLTQRSIQPIPTVLEALHNRSATLLALSKIKKGTARRRILDQAIEDELGALKFRDEQSDPRGFVQSRRGLAEALRERAHNTSAHSGVSVSERRDRSRRSCPASRNTGTGHVGVRLDHAHARCDPHATRKSAWRPGIGRRVWSGGGNPEQSPRDSDTGNALEHLEQDSSTASGSARSTLWPSRTRRRNPDERAACAPSEPRLRLGRRWPC